MIRDLVDLAYLPEFRTQVLSSIWAGRGLPGLWLGTYQAQTLALQAEVAVLRENNASLRSRLGDAVTASEYERLHERVSDAFSDYVAHGNEQGLWPDLVGDDTPGLEGEIIGDLVFSRWLTDQNLGQSAELSMLREQLNQQPADGGGNWDWTSGLCDAVDGGSLIVGGATQLGAKIDGRVQGAVLIAEGACFMFN